MVNKNYKRLGDYIQQVNVRNRELEVTTLLGVSNTKVLIPSIANTIGTNMSTYKIIQKGQFAYGTVTSRNGDRISVALSIEHDEALVSQIYIVFEVIDTELLLPEYLMMWFSRPEFDRYARYHSHGSTREAFDWDAMCDVELPIPSIEKQRDIVAEYQSIENKIKVNEQICDKLEEAAQALYRHWFVDFEFPNEEGLPYKSSGGEMVWNDEMEKEVPTGWEVGEFQDITKVTSGKNTQGNIGEKFPVYGAGGITGYIDDYLFDDNIIIIGRVGTHGKVFIEYGKSWPSDNTLVFTPIFLYFSYFILKSLNYDELNKGGVQALLTQTDLKEQKIITPNFDINIFENSVKSYYALISRKATENKHLIQIKIFLLSKIS